MSEKTIIQLTAEADQIRNEVNKFGNTRGRVHDVLQDIIDTYISRNALGYAIYADLAREIEVNAVSIPGSTRTKLLNDAGSAVTNLKQINEMTGIWDTATNKIKPTLESAYTIRLTYCIKTQVAGQGNYAETDLDIGLAVPVYKEITPIVKGANLIHNVSITIPIFAEVPFPANGGELFFFSNVAVTLWEVRILFIRHYKALP